MCQIRFIDSTDPAGIDHQIAQIGGELASTLVIAISKTGAYPETRKGLLEVQGAFQKAGLHFPKQGWLKRFPMFDWVGGRHSVMSAAGLLPAALQGIKIDEILKGAALMDEETRTTELRKNPAALLAMCWYWASKAVGSKDMIVLPYEDNFLLLRRYLMESLGKEFDLNGNRINEDVSVPGNKGSTDQHASPTQKDELEPGVTFGDYLFGILHDTRSVYANNRESITVTVKEVNPAAVGALIALYERAVGIYASLLNINAYPDPGIEAGKRAAGEVLALQKTVLKVLNDARCKEPDEALSLMEIADRCNATKQIEIICNIIEHLAVDGRVIIKDGNFGSPQDIKVQGVECKV
ncbi:Glucose-6-phosphate isomerase 1, chloroplastic, partial [Ananas comosus]